MVIRRVSPMSVAKVAGLLYALMGLLIGGMMSLVFMAIGRAAHFGDRPTGPVFGMLFGAGAIVILPVVYGVVGGIVAAISAAIYNVVAGIIGGIEIEIEGLPTGAVRIPAPDAV